jgi:hypothetical protein
VDVRGLANGATVAVNPNKVATVLRSTGYTIGAGRKQAPTYAAPVSGPAQVQALDGSDLKQLDGLNVQGTMRAIYLRGVLAGVIRPDGTGGDIVQFDGQDWLVVKVLESWSTWTKAAIVLQGG